MSPSLLPAEDLDGGLPAAGRVSDVVSPPRRVLEKIWARHIVAEGPG